MTIAAQTEAKRIPFKLQLRDLEILKAVYENRFMTFPLLNALFPPEQERTPAHILAKYPEPKEPGSNLKKRLRKLVHFELLILLTSYSGEDAYALDQAGAEELLEAKKKGIMSVGIARRYDWEEKAKKASRVNMLHTLMVAEFYVALEVAARSCPGLKLVHFERENKELRYKWEHGNQWPYVNPDAFLVLREQNKPPRTFFLEADRDTMSYDRMLEKFTQYSLFLADGQHKKAFQNVEEFHVLTIADTADRVRDLLNLLVKNTHAFPQKSTLPKGYRVPPQHMKLFYFTTEESYKNAYTNALSRIWRRADNIQEAVPIISAPLPRV